MKRILASIACVALFSACGGDKEASEVTTPENPAETYSQVMQENADIWSKTLKEMIPAIESPEKSESQLLAQFQASIEELGGELDVTVETKGKADMSDPKNPRMTSAFSLAGKMTGAFAGEVKADLEMVIADAMVFARLKDLEMNIPQFATSEIMAPIIPLLGKWYGDSFATINEAMGGEFDLQDMFMKSVEGAEKIRDEMIDIFTSHTELAFVEMQGVENGEYVFAVKVDNEVLKEKMIRFVEVSTPLSEEDRAQMEAEIAEELKETNISGTIRINPNTPKYFVLDLKNTDTAGEETTFTTNVQEDIKTITILTGTEYVTLAIEHNEGNHAFSLSGGEGMDEKETLVSGAMSDDTIDMKFFDEMGTEQGTLSLTRSGKEWSGKIVFAEEDMVMNIETLAFDETSLEIVFALTEGETKLGNGSINYTLKEVSQVDLEAPTQYEPYGTLMEQFIPTMSIASPEFAEESSSLSDAPEYDDYEMSQEEVEALLQQIEEMEGVEIPTEVQ